MQTLFLLALLAQGTDPAYEPLTRAFDALRARDYDQAIASFQKAAALAPARADIRKNLAYTLLKTGDSEAARLQFGEALRLEPKDEHLALEYAFLCFEAHDDASARKAEARRIFLRVRDSGADPEVRATAAQAFLNIDGPLQSGIERWQQALAAAPPVFSALFELAQLAEQRDELALAASSYRAAFQLLPARKSVLLDLARVENSRQNAEGAVSALLAASRGGEPRAAELAKEQLPERYPYVYEFRAALDLDPKNTALRRELAYLLLAMSEKQSALREEAEAEFQRLIAAAPDDYLATAQLGLLYLEDRRESEAMPLLKKVMANADSTTANRARIALHIPTILEERRTEIAPLDPRVLGERSYNAGFLKDALRYFTIAREANPVDGALALKLGWTHNLLHDDAAALRWFDLARRSADTGVASEAQKAFSNLRPEFQRFRTTFWMYPIYSSRWSDLLGYAQIKTEFRLKGLPLHPYVSVRFEGDVRGRSADIMPTRLSENAFLPGVGVATSQWHGATAWFEAGKLLPYVIGFRYGDYRGGVAWSRTRGSSLLSERSGRFLETTLDSVYLSRFGKDFINYSQNKFGYTTKLAEIPAQVFWATNVTVDVKRLYWADFIETGPGFRIHPPGAPPALSITAQAVHGVYLTNRLNPRRPNFNDFRMGVWYAFTR